MRRIFFRDDAIFWQWKDAVTWSQSQMQLFDAENLNFVQIIVIFTINMFELYKKEKFKLISTFIICQVPFPSII